MPTILLVQISIIIVRFSLRDSWYVSQFQNSAPLCRIFKSKPPVRPLSLSTYFVLWLVSNNSTHGLIFFFSPWSSLEKSTSWEEILRCRYQWIKIRDVHLTIWMLEWGTIWIPWNSICKTSVELYLLKKQYIFLDTGRR